MNLLRRHLDPLRWGIAFKKLLKLLGVKRGKGGDRRSTAKAAVGTAQSIAKALKAEDKSNTQAVIARRLGVARETVKKWFTTNGKDTNACKPPPDSRVKIPPTASPVILDRIEDGERQEQVAAAHEIQKARLRDLL